MTSISYDYNTAVVGSIFRFIPNTFAALNAAFAKRVACEKAETQLRALSDRQLADIGIVRGDIHQVVWND